MILHLENIGLQRESRWIFRNVNLRLEEGTITGIIGASGAGKTTLLSVMSGLLDVTEGSVFYQKKKILGPSVKLIPGYEDIQLVNQDFALDLYHSVEENVKEKILHLPDEDREKLISEVLDLLELSSLKNQKAHLLSGGEQQRLALARALACEPEVLLLDEPFVHLDQRLRLGVIGYLKRLNKVRNTTVVLVSHDGAEMMGVVDRIISLKNGKVDRVDAPHTIYYSPSDYNQGVLLGMLNRIKLGEDEVLFRPNEYDLMSKKIVVDFQRSVDTGLVVFNYFLTKNHEEVILSSLDHLSDITHFGISKRL